MTTIDYAKLGLIAPRKRGPIPAPFQDVASILDHPLAANPSAEALVGANVRYTFRELDTEINAAAAVLRDFGVRAGDRVALAARNDPQIAVLFLAVQRLGAIYVGVNPAHSLTEKSHQLASVGARVLIGDAESVATLGRDERALHLEHRITFEAGDTQNDWVRLVRARRGAERPKLAIDPHAPAAIAFTSGTTGLPKAAVHSQHNMAMMSAASGLMPYRREKVFGIAQAMIIPNMIVNWVLPVLSWGGKAVCMDTKDPAGMAAWINQEQVQSIGWVPTMIHDVLASTKVRASDFASLLRIRSGAMAVPGSLRERVRESFGFDLEVVYGLTEAPGCVTATDPSRVAKLGSSGRALPHLRVVAYDEEGVELAPGRSGRIGVSASASGQLAGLYTPMLGYWMQPDATREALRNHTLITGDLGYVSADGDLFVEGRKSDVIIRGGSNIYPMEIERVLSACGVRGCAVLGAPDERLGEQTVAFVEIDDGQNAEAVIEKLRQACRAELARYKQPDRWIVVANLPRNANHKVVKAELKTMYLDNKLG